MYSIARTSRPVIARRQQPVRRRARLGDGMTPAEIACAIDPLGAACSIFSSPWLNDPLAASADLISNVQGDLSPGQLQQSIAVCQANVRKAGANLSPDALQIQLQKCASDINATQPAGDGSTSIPWTAIGIIAALGAAAFVVSRV